MNYWAFGELQRLESDYFAAVSKGVLFSYTMNDRDEGSVVLE